MAAFKKREGMTRDVEEKQIYVVSQAKEEKHKRGRGKNKPR